MDRFYGNDSTQPAITTGTSNYRTADGVTNPTGGSAIHNMKPQFAPGDLIDSRYEVLGVIGRGGFGCVYKVFQVLLRKQFALKTLNPINTTETTILRLRKEAQAASRLEHPNLVQALDFGMIDGVQPFLVMDLVEGPTLAEYLREHGRLSVEDAVEIFIPLAQGIAYAHRQGVVHRDLKPSNVILSPDRTKTAPCIPKIVDFGIAKMKFSEESKGMSLTATGDVFGTPLYMSPEQCAGTGVDSRSDIYSLGCMFFEALTGAPPFQGHNPLEVMMQHSTAPIPSLKEGSLGEKFSPELERIVASMLAKLPEERYADSQVLADDLFWYKHGDVDRISVAKKPDATEIKRTARNNSILQRVLTGLGCIIFGVSIGYGVALFNRPAQLNVQAKPALDDVQTTSAGGGDTPEAFISQKGEPGYRKFQLPAFRGQKTVEAIETGWGTFHWWTGNGQHKSVRIPLDGKTPASVPENEKSILSLGYGMGELPYTLARFHHKDLSGIIIDRNMCLFDDETVGTIIESFYQQTNLELVSLKLVTMTPASLTSLGFISKLRWLNLSEVFVQQNQGGIRAANVSGKEICNFPNLPQLSVFVAEQMDDVSSALAKLNSENLTGLSLAQDTCTVDDIHSLTRFQKLKVLTLRGCTVDGASLNGDDVAAVVAKLPKLQKLAIDPSVLKMSPENLRVLKSKHLEILVAKQGKTEIPSSLLSAVNAEPEEVKIHHSETRICKDQEWFDCRKVSPATFGI